MSEKYTEKSEEQKNEEISEFLTSMVFECVENFERGADMVGFKTPDEGDFDGLNTLVQCVTTAMVNKETRTTERFASEVDENEVVKIHRVSSFEGDETDLMSMEEAVELLNQNTTGDEVISV